MNQVHAAVWEKLPPLPEPNGGCMAGCVRGKIILAGGTNWRDETKRWLDKVWVYDPVAATWNAGPSLPHALAYAGFASDGDRLWIAGGADGENGHREIFAIGADLKLKHVADLPHQLVFAGAAVRGSTLFVFGGTPDPADWTRVNNELFRVNLAGENAVLASKCELLPHGVGIPAVAAVSDGLCSFTGAWLGATNQAVSNLAMACLYENASGRWRSLAPYPQAARGVAAVALDDHRVFLAGGYGTDEQGFLSATYVYDTTSNRYSASAVLPFAATTCLVKCGEFIYALGGEDIKKHRTAACWRIRVRDLTGG